MSNEKVDVKDLSNAIMDYLTVYTEDIHEQVVEVTEDVTKRAIAELKERSRALFKSRSSNPYWSGWDSKIQVKGKLKYHRVIWNKTNYQLTHLLEFSHSTRYGGTYAGRPHIQPVEEKYKVEFVDLVEQKIRRTK